MTKLKESILVIGGSQSSIPFVVAAQNYGYKVILFDIDEDCPGAIQSDSFYRISTLDLTLIMSECDKIHDIENMIGCITYSSASATLLAVAKVAEKYGFPSFSIDSVKLITNKSLMKRCFDQSKIPNPDWIITNNIDEAIDFYRKSNGLLILKPSAGSQGSMGVALVNNVEVLNKDFEIAKNISADSKVIIETYQLGNEYSIDGIVVGDTPVILSVSQKFNLGPEFNYTMSGFSVTQDEDIVSAMTAVTIKAVLSLGITNSFFSTDIVLTINGPIVLECGILLDCKIDRMLFHGGINVYDLLIAVISRETIDINKISLMENIGLTFMFAPQEGYINIQKESVDKYKGVIEWEVMNGDYTKPPISISDVLGWAINRNLDHSRFNQEQYFEIL